MDLHGKLMNLQMQEDLKGRAAVVVQAFKRGHKDARHAAAEMVIEYDYTCNAVAMPVSASDGCYRWTPIKTKTV